MKTNSVNFNVNIYPQTPGFRSVQTMPANKSEHDTFVNSKSKEPKDKNPAWRIAAGVVLTTVGAFLLYKAFKKQPKNISSKNFSNFEEAKEFFKKLDINTEFHDTTPEHLKLLAKIEHDLARLKELGVKINKPDSITISDWSKTSELNELCKKRGVIAPKTENYGAFCAGAEKGENHIFIDAKQPEFKNFLHEMGHANLKTGKNSFWHNKGLTGRDFADKQLELLGSSDKVNRDSHVRGSNLTNILSLPEKNSPAKFVFPNTKRETRFVDAKRMIDKMYSETNCNNDNKTLSDGVANIFEGLMSKKTFSDETMLYYDFAGGTRIPNLNIKDKTYDEYMESLYNNKDLIQKLRENIKITKI